MRVVRTIRLGNLIITVRLTLLSASGCISDESPWMPVVTKVTTKIIASCRMAWKMSVVDVVESGQSPTSTDFPRLAQYCHYVGQALLVVTLIAENPCGRSAGCTSQAIIPVSTDKVTPARPVAALHRHPRFPDRSVQDSLRSNRDCAVRGRSPRGLVRGT